MVLRYYPDPVLRRKAMPVTVFDDALRDHCRRMFQVMDEEQGVGLAAPQVGAAVRLFVTDHAKRKADPDSSDRRIFINPVMEGAEGESVYEEGCLSFPGIYAKVTRPDRFTLRFQDETGAPQALALDVNSGGPLSFLAIVVQHELDHLDGICFVDHLTQAQLTLARRKLRDLEAGYKREHGSAGAVLRK